MKESKIFRRKYDKKVKDIAEKLGEFIQKNPKELYEFVH